MFKNNKHTFKTLLTGEAQKNFKLMKVLKKILIALVVLIALVLIAGLFVDKELKTSHTAVIDAPISPVFNAVNNLKDWAGWQPWSKYDPNMQMTYPEQTIGKGAYYDWTSENAGNGRMAITESMTNEKISTEVAFEGMGTALANFSFKPVDGGTEVTWDFYNEVPYPFNLMVAMSGGADGIKEDYKRGLQQLEDFVKEKMESTIAELPYKIQEVDMPQRHYVGVRQQMNIADLQPFYQTNLPKVHVDMAKKKAEMTSAPCGVFFSFDQATQQTDVLAGVAIAANEEVDGYDNYTTQKGKALLVDYYGPYDQMQEVYASFMTYIEIKGLKEGEVVVEEYMSDPSQEPDPKKWLTKVYFEVK